MERLEIKGKKLRVYQINQGGVAILTGNRTLPSEEHISFEEIKNERLYYVQKTYQYLVAAAIFVLIYLLILLDSLKNNNNVYLYNMAWGVFGLAFIFLFFLHRPKYYYIKTWQGKYLKFQIENNEDEVASFVKEVMRRRNIYLKEKYSIPNTSYSYDAQFSNLLILLKEEIITEEEYKQKLEILNKLSNQSQPTKVFFQYSQN